MQSNEQKPVEEQISTTKAPEDDQGATASFVLRMPSELLEQIGADAIRNDRSVNLEINERLKASFSPARCKFSTVVSFVTIPVTVAAVYVNLQWCW